MIESLIDPAISAAAFDVSDPLVVALAIIAAVILVIVIMFLSYFNVLRSISAYSYSNSRFKAVGTPFVSKSVLEGLTEASNLMDLSSRLAEYDVRVPQTPRITIEELEEALESETIRMLRNTLAAVPDGSKPFFRGYLVRMDALQLKKALRSLRSGQKVSYHPSYYVNAESIRMMAEISTPAEIADMYSESILGEALSEAIQHYPDSPVAWELALDKAVYSNLYSSVALVEDEIREPIKEFYGRMADVNNINILTRAKSLGISSSDTVEAMAPGGRELPIWMLEQLSEAQDMTAILAELDSTTYGKFLKEKGLKCSTPSEMEHSLEHFMLSFASEISAKHTLLAGPAIKFAYGKEREARNIMAVSRAVADGLGFNDIEPYIIAEGLA